MVDIVEVMQSSSSSSSSNSSSSGDDSSTSSASLTSLSESKSSKNAQEMTRCLGANDGCGKSVDATKNPVIAVQTSRNQALPSDDSALPVDTVICVDSESVKTAPMPAKTLEEHESSSSTKNDTPEPLPFQQEDDFPYLQDDESLRSTPDKSATYEQKQHKETEYVGTDLKDEDLARLLDSPQVIERCNNISAATTSSTAAAPDAAKPRHSPSLSSIASDDLEIPHPDTPQGLREAAPRFCQKVDTIEDDRALPQATQASSATMPSANPARQGQGTTSDDPSRQDQGSTFTDDVHQEKLQGLSNEETATRRHEAQAVVVEPRPERVAEVHPSLYQPPPYRHRADPIVHHLSIRNRPKHMRRTIPVRELFSAPLHKLWLSKFASFNHLQSEVANTLAHSDDSIVVSAPTGAGKTALFEIAMARFFAADLAHNALYNNGKVSNQRKIVYVAPSKALCEERYEDWTRRLTDINVGIQCAMITGDAEPGDSFRDVAAAHVILTTPEKWDSLTRRWTENVFLFGTVKLVMLDEVHLLGDGTRGCCLESIVCRMKTIQRATVAASANYEANRMSSYTHTSSEALSSFLRIVGVSATLPNVSSIAAFLEANEAYAFDASYRPVPLETHVVGCGDTGNNAFLFGRRLDERVPDLIKRFSKAKSSIVFCHTKKEAEVLSAKLSQDNGIAMRDDGRNMNLASQTHLAGLQAQILRGVAYHHAGLAASDRKLVEKAFTDGKVKVLCATSTLAMGVNLPAHLVIIKGTSAWRGGYHEIDTGTLLQMIGRAGRPGFDDSGTAIIMTDNSSKTKYEQLSGGMEAVESHLPANLTDVMNTEISQQVIRSFESSQDWIKGTFFFCRAKENPMHYGLSSSGYDVETSFEKHCLDALHQLNDEGIIAFSDASGEITPTPACHIMSQHMVDFKSMSRIIQLPFDANQATLIKELAEFDGLHRPVRRAEKKPLKEVHKLIKYKLDGPPSKVTIKGPNEKAFVLLQAAIGQHSLEDFTLRQEMSYMVEFATRMLSAVEEYSSHGSRNGQVALQSLRLRRSLATSLWGAADGVLNQLPGVGHKTTAKLRFSKIASFADVLSAKSADIERAAGREPPFGKQLRASVSKILKSTLQLSASVELAAGVPKTVVCCLVRRGGMAGMEHCAASDKSSRIVNYTLAVYSDRPGGDCLAFLPNITGPGEYRLQCPPCYGKIFCHLAANFVGLDERLTLEGNAEIHECAFTATKSGKTKAPPSLSNGSNDARIKRDPQAKRKSTQQTIEFSYEGTKKQRASPHIFPSRSSTKANSQVARAPRKKPITPSPVPPNPSQHICRSASLLHQQSPPKENHPPIRHSASNVQRLRVNRTSDWRQEKRSQKALQQSAFRRKQDNPFSHFQFDPNDIEAKLVDSSIKSTSPLRNDQSVIPPRRYEELTQASMTSSTPRNAFRSSGGSRSFNGESGRKGLSDRRSRGARGRRSRKFPRMADRDLLSQKAMEQQEYHHHAQVPQYAHHYQTMVNERIAPSANVPSRGSFAPVASASESIFPEGHPMREASHGFVESANIADFTDPWNVTGLTTQSQPPFTHYMNNAASKADYGRRSLVGLAHADESHEVDPYPSFQQSAFATRSQGYSNQQDTLDDSFELTFGAPQSMQPRMQWKSNPSSYFTSQPSLETANEAVPDNEEEDALFSAAFL